MYKYSEIYLCLFFIFKTVYNSGGRSSNMGRVSLKYGLATHEEMALQLCLTDGVLYEEWLNEAAFLRRSFVTLHKIGKDSSLIFLIRKRIYALRVKMCTFAVF